MHAEQGTGQPDIKWLYENHLKYLNKKSILAGLLFWFWEKVFFAASVDFVLDTQTEMWSVANSRVSVFIFSFYFEKKNFADWNVISCQQQGFSFYFQFWFWEKAFCRLKCDRWPTGGFQFYFQFWFWEKAFCRLICDRLSTVSVWWAVDLYLSLIDMSEAFGENYKE